VRIRVTRLLVLTTLAALAGALMLTSPLGAHPQRHHHGLKANLNGAQEVPGPGDSDGSGKARIRVLPGFGAVCFKLSWEDIAAPTAAHIHRGAKGVAGPVVVPLFVGTADEKGCVDDLDVGLLREIRRHPRRFYVNIHNADFPDGAIRGQLKRNGHRRGHSSNRS
jgi:hypothetical protein